MTSASFVFLERSQAFIYVFPWNPLGQEIFSQLRRGQIAASLKWVLAIFPATVHGLFSAAFWLSGPSFVKGLTAWISLGWHPGWWGISRRFISKMDYVIKNNNIYIYSRMWLFYVFYWCIISRTRHKTVWFLLQRLQFLFSVLRAWIIAWFIYQKNQPPKQPKTRWYGCSMWLYVRTNMLQRTKCPSHPASCLYQRPAAAADWTA